MKRIRKLISSRACLHSEKVFLIWSNLFILISCSIVLLISIYFCKLFNDSLQRFSALIYTNWMAMLLLALLSVVISIVGFFGGRKIRLELMFWNFWGMLVLLGPLLGLGAAALFTNMLLRLASRHQWGHANFSGLRRRFCQPGTFDNKCMPPISVANEPSKLSEWCQLEFQSTDCASIFMAAFSDACEYLDSLTNLTGALAISAVFFMGVCMMACVRIITVPVMMQSLVALIHFIQLIPALVGIILGKINLEQDSLELAPIKIGVLQLLMGSFQLVLLLFGFFCGPVEKSQNAGCSHHL